MPTWMFRTHEAEAERQASAREQRQRNGNCIRCGLARDGDSVQLCTACLMKQRLAARQRIGYKGDRRGRKPFV